MKLIIQLLQTLLLVSIIEGNFFDTLFAAFKKKTPVDVKKEISPSEKSSEDSSEKGKCQRCIYRPYDGYCNNLENPTWGTPNTPFKRMFKNYSYEDGLCAKADLPNPRSISLQGFIHLTDTEDLEWTLNLLVWAQLIAHDTAAAKGVPETGQYINSLGSCVNGKIIGKQTKDSTYIKLPIDDPYNIPEGKVCMNFARTKSTCDKKSDKPAEQINDINSYLDASLLYGNSEAENKKLRSFKNGELLYQTRNGRIYPPQSLELCYYEYTKTTEKMCFQTGDSRANQSPYISFAHIILLRYHNNIAKKLSKLNPHWNDETIFQEGRRIVIATIQHITIKEFAPILLGPTISKKSFYSLNLLSPYHSVYDKTVDPSCINEFTTVAYRTFHSGIRGHIKLYAPDRKEYKTIQLSKHFDDPSIFAQNDTDLGIAIGFSKQQQWKIDRYHDDELTENLFKYASLPGLDLLTLDFHRTGDHGTVSYAVALKLCGLSNPKSFDDFGKFMPKENVELLKRMYPKGYKQVDLRVGGQLETGGEYGLTGPTYNCILLEQFDSIKRGDFYWYENEKQNCPFTKEQLVSIKKGSTISSLICNQIDGMTKIQQRGFEKEVPLYNNLMDCKDIPTIDLNLWKDKKE